MASDEAHPRIGEHYLVYPPDASPEMMQQVNICARFMNDALERADHDKARRAKMAPMEVFCLTARLFEQCPKTMLGIWDKQRKNGDRFDPVGHKAMKGVRDFSLVFREEICRELFPASPEAERLFNDAVREFIRTGRYLP